MTEVVCNLAPNLRKIRGTRPKKFSRFARWLEPIETILENNSSGDLRAEWENCEYFEWELSILASHGIPLPPVRPRFTWTAEMPVPDSAWRKRKLEFFDAQEAWNDKYFIVASELHDVDLVITLKNLLEEKRQDEQYSDIVASIRAYGFVRPLTARVNTDTIHGYMFGDGHHRLAAAIDLGYTHVPLQIVDSTRMIGYDSGEWTLDSKIARRN